MRRILIAAILLVSAISVGAQAGEKPDALLYKTPDCGCCEGYADYLRQNGYKVTVKPSHEMPMIKKLAGVPEALEGCHTTMIDGYVVEGHVPVGAVDKLLDERPKVRGISLPGMPQGSPGMSGTKSGPFRVYTIDGQASPQVFFVE